LFGLGSHEESLFILRGLVGWVQAHSNLRLNTKLSQVDQTWSAKDPFELRSIELHLRRWRMTFEDPANLT
jgi:hypothetical protein